MLSTDSASGLAPSEVPSSQPPGTRGYRVDGAALACAALLAFPWLSTSSSTGGFGILEHATLISLELLCFSACHIQLYVCSDVTASEMPWPGSLTLGLCFISVWNLSSKVVYWVIISRWRAEVRPTYVGFCKVHSISPSCHVSLVYPLVTVRVWWRAKSFCIFLISLGFSLSYSNWVKAHELFLSFYKYCQIFLKKFN